MSAIVLVIVGALILIVAITVAAKLVSSILPSLVLIWFVVLILRGIVRSLFK